MPIDFPNSPTTGQVYTYLGKSWIWNGTGWDAPKALSEVGAVRTFANATARTAAIPSPTEGIVSYLNDVNLIQTNNGSAWVTTGNAGVNAYNFVQTLYYTSSGTFTKASYPWLRAVRVRVQGGGGGGGGVAATTSGQFLAAGGGGGGGYAEGFITNIAGMADSVTVTVGAGGAGAISANTGAAGGTSAFTAAVQAAGGSGGDGLGGIAFWLPAAGGFGGSGNGDLVILGGDGGDGNNVNTNGGYGGHGGSSVFAGQLKTTAAWQSNSDGRQGKLFGGGGGGAAAGQSSGVARNGGAGRNGIIIMELYA
jgi:hypothetical protein